MKENNEKSRTNLISPLICVLEVPPIFDSNYEKKNIFDHELLNRFKVQMSLLRLH